MVNNHNRVLITPQSTPPGNDLTSSVTDNNDQLPSYTDINRHPMTYPTVTSHTLTPPPPEQSGPQTPPSFLQSLEGVEPDNNTSNPFQPTQPPASNRAHLRRSTRTVISYAEDPPTVTLPPVPHPPFTISEGALGGWV